MKESSVVNNLIISGGSEFNRSSESSDEIIHELKRFWDVEAIGVCDKVQDETSSSVCDVSLDIIGSLRFTTRQLHDAPAKQSIFL